MRIGIVSNWCNRGQGVIARQIRSIFDEAGHETFVLARPTNTRSPIGNFIDTRESWKGERITQASTFAIPEKEYVEWAKDTGIEVSFFDMCLQFDEVLALRNMGIRTIGRFVWERFPTRSLANKAFETIYSLTHCEKEVYKNRGIKSPYIRYGIHPSIYDFTEKNYDDNIRFIFHGGLQGRRKPIEATIRAFKAVKDPNIRLIIKSQSVRKTSEDVYIEDDPRISHIVKDMDDDEYKSLYTSCHVSLVPARWEGLGVHLFESLGYGMPVISNDIPPINEVIKHNKSGLLINSVLQRTKANGMKIYDPDVDDLSRCIEELSNPDKLKEMIISTREAAKEFSWNNTKKDYLALLEGKLRN